MTNVSLDTLIKDYSAALAQDKIPPVERFSWQYTLDKLKAVKCEYASEKLILLQKIRYELKTKALDGKHNWKGRKFVPVEVIDAVIDGIV